MGTGAQQGLTPQLLAGLVRAAGPGSDAALTRLEELSERQAGDILHLQEILAMLLLKAPEPRMTFTASEQQRVQLSFTLAEYRNAGSGELMVVLEFVPAQPAPPG